MARRPATGSHRDVERRCDRQQGCERHRFAVEPCGGADVRLYRCRDGGTLDPRIIPGGRQREEDDVLARIRRGEKVDHFDTIRQRKDGTLVPISLTISPIVDDDGGIIGASKIARDISQRKEAEAERARLLAAVQASARLTETLNRVGTVVASTLDRDAVVQAVIDEAVSGTHAEVGAFVYKRIDPFGEESRVYAASSASRGAFANVSNALALSAIETFDPSTLGEGVVRLDDVGEDRRHGFGRLPVHSYLAVPVKSRWGDVLGGLFFGHSETSQFTEEDERAASGIAMWASIALENARLYMASQVSSRLKDEFLATLSHELRTPLNALLGYTRMIRSGAVAPLSQDRAIATIERNAMSLRQIVEDILDVSRIISGKTRLNLQPIDLPALVQSAVESVAPAADAKEIAIDLELDPVATPITGDPVRLQQVIWNLMSNAVKFTPRGGRVSVQLERLHDEVEIRIRDTGIGIEPDLLPHVFERFRQGDATVQSTERGLGLGLEIARQLVEMHRGTIDAASPGEGKGATFRIKLPSSVVPADAVIIRSP